MSTSIPDNQSSSSGLGSSEIPETYVFARQITTDATPEVIDGFQIQSEIGRGGMGMVYRAKDLALKREVAVKILKSEYVQYVSIAERFLLEAQVTGQLQHPGVPAVYHVGVMKDGRPFLAMRLIRGQTLEALKQQKAPIQLLTVFESIAHTVGYAHAHQVIHRDLKPANVMIGSFGEVQVMDWGLAKLLASPQHPHEPLDSLVKLRVEVDLDTNQTQAGDVMGTPAFMAPEQALGTIDIIDPRTDVFALGGILCFLLTGEPPYSGMDVEATLQSAALGNLDGAYARLDACGADPALIRLAKICMSPDQKDRPADGEAVVQLVTQIRNESENRMKQAEIEIARAEVHAQAEIQRRKNTQRYSTIIISVLLLGIIGVTASVIRAEIAKAREAKRAEEAVAANTREAQRAQEAEEAKKSEAKRAQEAEQALAAQKKSQALEQEANRLAKENRNVAAKIYDDSVSILRTNIDMVRREIRTPQELQKAQLQILTRVRDQLEKLDKMDYDKTRSDIAWHLANQSIVEIQIQSKQFPEAERGLESGKKRLEESLKKNPEPHSPQVSYSIQYRLSGDLKRAKGLIPEAIEDWKKANAILVPLHPRFPNARERSNTCYNQKLVLEKLAQTYRSLGRTKDALDSHLQNLPVLQYLYEQNKERGEVNQLSSLYQQIISLQTELKDWVAVRTYLSQQIPVEHQFLLIEPGNMECQRRLRTCFDRILEITNNLKEPEQIPSIRERAVQIYQSFTNQHSKQTDMLIELAKHARELGDHHLQANLPAKALSQFRIGLQATSKLKEQQKLPESMMTLVEHLQRESERCQKLLDEKKK